MIGPASSDGTHGTQERHQGGCRDIAGRNSLRNSAASAWGIFLGRGHTIKSLIVKVENANNSGTFDTGTALSPQKGSLGKGRVRRPLGPPYERLFNVISCPLEPGFRVDVPGKGIMVNVDQVKTAYLTTLAEFSSGLPKATFPSPKVEKLTFAVFAVIESMRASLS